MKLTSLTWRDAVDDPKTIQPVLQFPHPSTGNGPFQQERFQVRNLSCILEHSSCNVRGVQLPDVIDFSRQTPVDSVFQIYKEQFAYDETPLNARVESKTENPEGWILEKISFDAAYGSERVLAYLFLPKNVTPPYQTVIYFPGSASAFKDSSKDIENYYEFPLFLSFIVKTGRAVLYPVYKGTFERRVSLPNGDPSRPDDSHAFRDYQVQLVKDFRRSVDYLESRPDVASKKLAYSRLLWNELGRLVGGNNPGSGRSPASKRSRGNWLHRRHGPTGSKANQLCESHKDPNPNPQWEVRH